MLETSLDCLVLEEGVETKEDLLPTDRPRIVHQKDHSVLNMTCDDSLKIYEPKITIIAKIKSRNPTIRDILTQCSL